AAKVTGPLCCRSARSIMAVTAKRPLVVKRMVMSLMKTCERNERDGINLLGARIHSIHSGCLYPTNKVKYSKSRLKKSGLFAGPTYRIDGAKAKNRAATRRRGLASKEKAGSGCLVLQGPLADQLHDALTGIFKIVKHLAKP